MLVSKLNKIVCGHGERRSLMRGTCSVNKKELIDAVAARLDGDRKSASTAVEGVLDEITRAIVKGDRVQLTGFGTFEKRARAARTARNPQTGETVKVKKTSVPAFKAGATLKSVVSGATKLPRATAAKTTAKKTAAKAAAKSTTGATRTATTKKAAPAAKKTPAKKAAASKAAAKKTTAKKTTAKKAPAKKARR